MSLSEMGIHMLRRLFTTLSLVVIGLLSVPALASASTPLYPAPPVDPAAAQYVPADPVSTTASLASTGAGFSVGTAVAIGVAVLLVGLVLAFAGNRIRKTTV